MSVVTSDFMPFTVNDTLSLGRNHGFLQYMLVLTAPTVSAVQLPCICVKKEKDLPLVHSVIST